MPRWKELKKYCDKNGWELYKNTDHYYYRKKLDDGTFLFTKVSRSSSEINKGLFRKILTNQLKITLEEFNKGLR